MCVLDCPPTPHSLTHRLKNARSFSMASGRGRDKWGRRRSAAIPPNELSWENVGQMWRKMRALKRNMANM